MTRKTVEGKFRNKQRTKQKLLAAVGKILRTKGHHALGVNKIAETAKVDKKLIYLYFGGVDKLVETYIKQQDYWWQYEENTTALIENNKKDFGEKLSTRLLTEQLDYFYHNKEMQKIILWEISEKNRLMRQIADKREETGDQLFPLSDPVFKDSPVDFKAIQAIQVAGIYYLVLHVMSNGSRFCGVDINNAIDRKRIAEAAEQIVKWSYAQAKKVRRKNKYCSP